MEDTVAEDTVAEDTVAEDTVAGNIVVDIVDKDMPHTVVEDRPFVDQVLQHRYTDSSVVP